MRKKLLLFTLIALISNAVFSQQVIRDEVVNFSKLAAYAAAHPELYKPCETCLKEEAEDNPPVKVMPLPEGANLKMAQPLSVKKAEPGPLPEAPSPAPFQNWIGDVDQPGNHIPPDTYGAVGLNHVITATNDFIIVHDKANGAVLNRMPIAAFTGSPFTCDPQMFFDPTEQRWLFCAIGGCFLGSINNPIIIMTSNTPDPAGAWRNVQFIPFAGGFIDHPYLGFDGTRIVIGARKFTNDHAGPDIYLINKAAMLAGIPIIFGVNAQSIVRTPADGDCPRPVTIYLPPFSNTDNPAPGTSYIVQAWNGTSIRLSTITGNIPNAVWNTGTAVFPSVPAQEAWSITFPDINNTVQQQNPETRRLASNDHRVSSAVMMNGNIWCSQHIGFPAGASGNGITHTDIQYWQLNGTPAPNFGNVIQRGRTGAIAGQYRWFSSIAVNRNEDVLIGYSMSNNTNLWPSAAYSTRRANTPLNTLDDPVNYHTGEGRYWKDFQAGSARWGDYSQTALDPVDNSLWTVQEYASLPVGVIPPDENSRYGVWWSQVYFMNITGDDFMCDNTPKVYSVTNMPPGATVTWDATPAGIVSFNPTGPTTNPSTTVTKIFNGPATVIIRATVALNGNTGIVTKTITLKPPIINGTYITNGQELPIHIWFGNPTTDYNNVCNLQMTFTNMNISGANSVTWSLLQAVPSQPMSWSQNGNNLNFYLTSIGQTALFRINTQNSCGTSTLDFGFKSIDCTGGGGGCKFFQVSPNPASANIKVHSLEKPVPCSKTPGLKEEGQKTISEIRIFDNSGNLLRAQKGNGTVDVIVNLKGLKSGVYVVEIADGNYKERQQIIIQE